MNEEPHSKLSQCPVCLEDINPMTENASNRNISASNICSGTSHDSKDIIHQKCLEWFISARINKAVVGTCPVIYCPYDHRNEARMLKFDKWKDLVDSNLVYKYYDRADSVLSILCGSCHTTSILSVNFDPQVAIKASDGDSPVSVEELQSTLKQFDQGQLTTDAMYILLIERFYPKEFSKTMVMNKAQWQVFKSTLSQIQNPERRCALHLRWLRDYPTIYTRCCDFQHCFRCKCKGSHPGKSCEENIMTFDASIVNCPNCNISIAKGDGCNTIVCACGKQFSWEYEKEMNRRLMGFMASYPRNTDEACARVLCRLWDGYLDGARAWRSKHLVGTNEALLKIWKEQYPDCPHQAASLSSIRGTYENEGLTLARDAWLNTYTQEARKHQMANLSARAHLFQSLCHGDNNSGRLAHLLLNSKYFPVEMVPHLTESINTWINDNKPAAAKGKFDMELASAYQFLFLYGDQSIAPKHLLQVDCPAATQWDLEQSNLWLKYSHDKTSATREGSVSCYPAVFADLQGPKSSLTVRMDAASRGSNWLTFGLCERGKLGNSNSNGVGRSVQSWGLCDDRSRSTDIPARIFARGEPILRTRQLEEGDVLKATVDTAESWLEISMNETIITRMPIPPVQHYSQYIFAMTLANNHTARIINDQVFLSRGLVNPSHKEMYQNAIKFCRKIDSDEWDEEAWFASDLMKLGSEWVELFDRDEAAAAQGHVQLMYLLCNTGIVDMRNRKLIQKISCGELPAIDMDFIPFPITWTNIVRAVCWSRNQRNAENKNMTA